MNGYSIIVLWQLLTTAPLLPVKRSDEIWGKMTGTLNCAAQNKWVNNTVEIPKLHDSSET